MCAGMCVSRVVWSTHDAVCGAHYNTHASHTREVLVSPRSERPVPASRLWRSGRFRTGADTDQSCCVGFTFYVQKRVACDSRLLRPNSQSCFGFWRRPKPRSQGAARGVRRCAYAGRRLRMRGRLRVFGTVHGMPLTATWCHGKRSRSARYKVSSGAWVSPCLSTTRRCINEDQRR